MIHIMLDINEHQDQRYTRDDNNGRDLYLLGVNVLVKGAIMLAEGAASKLRLTHMIQTCTS